MSKRLIFEGDTYEILKNNSFLQSIRDKSSFITGIPDLKEIGINLDEYETFVEKYVKTIAEFCTNPKAYIIFIQTDNKAQKRDGISIWVDKAYMITKAMKGYKLLWHKIVIQEKKQGRRPRYLHFLCFSKQNIRGDDNNTMTHEDILLSKYKIYENAFPLEATMYAIKFVDKYASKYTPYVIDAFAGRGSLFALVEHMKVNLTPVGIEIDPKQVEYIKHIQLKKDNNQLIAYFPGLNNK